MTKLVTVGSIVIIRMDGQKYEYTLVYPEESDLTKGKISIESPLGRILLGQGEDSEVDLQIPEEGKLKCKIVKVR
jgi:transcription elongation factor GreA